MSQKPELVRLLKNISNANLIISEHDKIEIDYVAAGNGAGEISEVRYLLAGQVVSTLSLTYNADNKIISCIKS